MLQRLSKLQRDGTPIRVGLVGAGCMGRGIAIQVALTPGMEMAWIADTSPEAAESARCVAGTETVTGTCASELLEQHPVDVLVESTNSIGPAYEYSNCALEHGAHVVLMNAEVDLALGPLLTRQADELGLIVTSDAGDQHGVLATMIEEISLWGFRILQAGNIKGFHDLRATPESIAGEAAKRNLSPVQCCAYTDGTKLHIEMAVLANGFGFLPPDGGMTGPRAGHVSEALELFDLESYGKTARVDYLLGAEPGGGVYVIASCEAPANLPYLSYYKLGDGPYYLFYRPYHLCHLETPRAIARAALYGEAVLQPRAGRVTDVFAFAKGDLAEGTRIGHAIGSAECYGLIQAATPETHDFVPIHLIERDRRQAPDSWRLCRPVARDEPLRWSDFDVPDTVLVKAWKLQQTHSHQ